MALHYLLTATFQAAIWPLTTIGSLLNHIETHVLALLQRPETHFRMFASPEMAAPCCNGNVRVCDTICAIAVLCFVPYMLRGDYHGVPSPVGWLTKPLWRDRYALAVALCLARIWLIYAVWNHTSWQYATLGEEGGFGARQAWVRAMGVMVIFG
ncbi:hypothetical protein DL546_000044 [Coniochaeta pulveracea]|uniref:Uncharacterized protein n=1 Tax=Coniochaeta pulveracea TaxID=177199 RepID=A0A420XZJ1_9PEZI|nr:hypothetical protein DL546_000044 [Coniochaeta pulveracea]